MCRDRLDQFCDKHDLVLRAALLIIPAVLYAAYLAWAADRFDFICGSFGNYKAFAPGIAAWMVYFLLLPLFLWRRFRRKHGPLSGSPCWAVGAPGRHRRRRQAHPSRRAVTSSGASSTWRLRGFPLRPVQMQWLAPGMGSGEGDAALVVAANGGVVSSRGRCPRPARSSPAVVVACYLLRGLRCGAARRGQRAGRRVETGGVECRSAPARWCRLSPRTS